MLARTINYSYLHMKSGVLCLTLFWWFVWCTVDLEHVDNCTQCDRGIYCDTPGLLDIRGPCDAGYLCHGGAYTSGPLDGVTGKSGIHAIRWNHLIELT